MIWSNDGSLLIFSFPVVSESFFNGIVEDFCHQGVDLNGFGLNGFLVQLSQILCRFMIFESIFVHL